MQEITEISAKVKIARTAHEVLNLKASVIGKNGILTQEFKKMGSLAPNEKIAKGQELNRIKTEFETLAESRLLQIKIEDINKNLADETVDITTPSEKSERGKLHPVSFVITEIEDFFFKHGFTVHDGPEIEDDYHNFEALNFPSLHPARNMHDTFYIEGSEKLLRTHTSSVQIRRMQNGKPPFRFIAHGKTYRFESDRTHVPMFHQIEGVCIEEGITFSHLKTIIEDFLRHFFVSDKIEIRFRSSFFPFTEPSCEVDINTGSGYMEVMGCGMVHRNVLNNCNIDASYRGFAFGMGVERLAMLKYGIADVRDCISPTHEWRRHYGF